MIHTFVKIKADDKKAGGNRVVKQIEG